MLEFRKKFETPILKEAQDNEHYALEIIWSDKKRFLSFCISMIKKRLLPEAALPICLFPWTNVSQCITGDSTYVYGQTNIYVNVYIDTYDYSPVS